MLFHSLPFLICSNAITVSYFVCFVFFFSSFSLSRLILFARLLQITYSLFGAVFQNYASQPSLTPDDDVFKHLSLTYANNHAKMSRGVACKSATPQFEQGITNGNAWYPLTGGMQVRKAFDLIYLPHLHNAVICLF